MARPLLHFTAHSGWINDPHGITYRDGQYHLFFQYVPDSLVWAKNCHWGHATSHDLLTFTEHPPALAPGDGDDGVWTGCLVTGDAGDATIFYTSAVEPDLGMARVRTATPTDDSWLSWQKGAVIATPPEGLGVRSYRDPFLFRDGDRWEMFVGAGLADGTATALGYHSAGLTAISDAADWTFEGIAAARSSAETEPVWTGEMLECPQLIEFGGRHVLLGSVWDPNAIHYVAYGVGSYLDGRFTADTWGQLSFGESYYAPSFYRDAAGAPSLMFWMRGVADAVAGWAGAHSVPHSLRLDGDVLVATPHADVLAHRAASLAPGVVGAGGHTGAMSAVGAAMDVEWEPVSPTASLRIDADGELAFTLAVADGTLTLSVPDRGDWAVPYRGGAIRVIVDGPLVEVSSGLGVVGSGIRGASGELWVSGDLDGVSGWVLG